jgi:hypothetical protein
LIKEDIPFRGGYMPARLLPHSLVLVLLGVLFFGLPAQALADILNIPNWNAPGRTLGGSGFGEITSARDPRIIQLGAKVIW